jgi:hypothetical protein
LRKLLVMSIVSLAVLGGGVATDTAQAKTDKKCPGVIQGVKFYRSATWNWQNKLGVGPTKSVFETQKVASCAYARWVAQEWMKRAKTEREKYLDHVRYIRSLNSSPTKAICYVFGNYCSQALRVSYCETGGTYWVGSSNGQYKGIFQMGERERATYGHGATALEQARAAWDYFVASGSDWSPWECKPW